MCESGKVGDGSEFRLVESGESGAEIPEFAERIGRRGVWQFSSTSACLF